MRVSLLVSTYNGEQYIIEQLNSLNRQSYQLDEVVIIDDCSKDRTVALIESYIINNNLQERWRLEKNTKNKGWKNNFYEGVSKTTGDIVFFCDQDDIWMDNKVEYTLSAFSNSSVNVVATKETIWDGKKSERVECPVKSTENDSNRITLKDKFFIECSGCTMAFRRSFFEDIKPYYVSGMAHDDFLWKFGLADESLVLLSHSTILHRIHGKNESRKKRSYSQSLEVFDYQIQAISSLQRFIEENKEDYQEIINRLKHKCRGYERRKLFYKTKNPLYFFELVIRYTDIYTRKRQLIGDMVLVYGRR